MIDGLLIVDKPAGMTSHDVVGRCRRIVGQRRVGHSGTLDPGATGVLLVALGRATRLIRFLSDLPKTYSGEVVLGRTTSTLDDEGDTTATFDMPGISADDVRDVASRFVGDIMQVPPMVSALKVDGKRLHRLARDGIEVEREPRAVTISSIDVHATDEPNVFTIDTTVSSGTYIRSLASDIGTALGGGAHLRNLRRTAIGDFTQERAATLERLEVSYETSLLAVARVVGHLPVVVADSAMANDVAHGRRIRRSDDVDGPVAVVADGDLLAVYEPFDDQFLKAGVVMANR